MYVDNGKLTRSVAKEGGGGGSELHYRTNANDPNHHYTLGSMIRGYVTEPFQIRGPWSQLWLLRYSVICRHLLTTFPWYPRHVSYMPNPLVSLVQGNSSGWTSSYMF
jgi:hypothetical protein